MAGKTFPVTLGITILIITALSFLTPTDAMSEDWTGNVNFFLGQKSLDKDDWEPVEDQDEFGAEISWGKTDWPILIATDILASLDEQTFRDPFFGNVNLKGSTTELDLGIRKIWGSESTRPYLGGGLALINGEIEIESVSADDNAAGFWIGGGVFWRLGKRFNIGFSVRYSNAEVTIEGFDVDAGGVHGGLLLGWGWPAKS